MWDCKDLSGTKFRKGHLPDGLELGLSPKEVANTNLLPKGTRFFRDDVSLTSEGESKSGLVPFIFNGNTYRPSKGRHWRTGDDVTKLSTLAYAGRISPGKANIFFKLYFDDFPLSERSNLWTDLKCSEVAVCQR